MLLWLVSVKKFCKQNPGHKLSKSFLSEQTHHLLTHTNSAKTKCEFGGGAGGKISYTGVHSVINLTILDNPLYGAALE
jgi:hypothetical protein